MIELQGEGDRTREEVGNKITRMNAFFYISIARVFAGLILIVGKDGCVIKTSRAKKFLNNSGCHGKILRT